MKAVFLWTISLIAFIHLSAQDVKKDSVASVNWLTLEEAFLKQKEKPRKLFVFVYSEKNDSSRLMLDSTFTDSTIADFLNLRFYPVKIKAETTEPITHFDTTYTNVNGTHDVVYQLLNGKPVYPGIVFFREDSLKSVINKYYDAQHFLPLVIYVLEEIYTSTEPEDFEKYFFKTYPPNNKSGYVMFRSLVKWMDLEEALEKNEKNPKRIFIDISVNWRTSCTMMSMTTYNNKVIADILNKYYYPVKFTATTRDTLVFGREYVNTGSNTSYHQLAWDILEGKMQFPANIYLDGNSKLINRTQVYLTPEALEPMLMYYAEEKYKAISYNKYLKTFNSKIFPKE